MGISLALSGTQELHIQTRDQAWVNKFKDNPQKAAGRIQRDKDLQCSSWSLFYRYLIKIENCKGFCIFGTLIQILNEI